MQRYSRSLRKYWVVTDTRIENSTWNFIKNFEPGGDSSPITRDCLSETKKTLHRSYMRIFTSFDKFLYTLNSMIEFPKIPGAQTANNSDVSTLSPGSPSRVEANSVATAGQLMKKPNIH